MSAPPARRHAQRATPRRPRQVPPFEAIARGISGTGSLSSPPQHTLTQVLGLDGARGPIPPPVTKGGRQCPCRARPGGRGPRHRAEPNPVTRPSLESLSRLPVTRALTAEGIIAAVKGAASLAPKPVLIWAHCRAPRDSAGGAFAWIGLDRIGCNRLHGSAAACSRLQQTPSATGSIVHRWHSGATRRTWLQQSLLRCCSHTCVAQRETSRRAAVPVQTWTGDGLSPGADVGGGWAQSRCGCGQPGRAQSEWRCRPVRQVRCER